MTQKSPSAHHRTTLSGYIFATKAYIDNRKNLLNNTISSTLPHNMMNFGSLRAEIDWRVWGTPKNFNGFRVLAYCTDVAQQRSTKLCMMFGRPLAGALYFWGILSPNGILPGAKFTLRASLAFSNIGSVSARHSSSGSEPNFAAWYTRNGITKLSLLVIFNRGRHLYSEGNHHVGHRPTF